MQFLRLLSAGALGFSGIAQAAYTMTDKYDMTNFFAEFDFFDQPDPTHGTVSYVDVGIANKTQLAGYVDNSVFLGVDYSSTGVKARNSVRLTSKKTFESGLFVADIAHMPTGCGVWPAMWMFGPDWPNGGEIDILEGVNSQSKNVATLHTGENSGKCQMAQGDCTGNKGCSQSFTNTNSYGEGFNAIGGGVYAMEWNSDAISVWFFPRNAMPSNASLANPNPSTWPAPNAQFLSNSGCDIGKHFKTQSFIINTSMCGDWAGKVWSTDATCAPKATTCEAYVAANPEAFEQAYWQINSIKVYSQNGAKAKRVPFRKAGTPGASPRGKRYIA